LFFDYPVIARCVAPVHHAHASVGMAPGELDKALCGLAILSVEDQMVIDFPGRHFAGKRLRK
jgi:hypothetical protein